MNRRQPRSELRAALAHFRAGRLADAETACRARLAAEPDDAEAANLLGAIRQAAGETKDAAGMFRRAIAARPEFAAAYSNLGAVLNDLGQLDDAEAALRRALVLDPKAAAAHNNLGSVLRSLGRRDEAAAAYRGALELQPDYDEARRNLQVLRRERAPPAKQLFRRGVVLMDRGEPERAAAAFREAADAKPGYAEALSNLGVILHQQDKLEEAEAAYREALDHHPDYAPAHGNLGMALRAQGRLEEAVACFRAAMALRPEQGGALNNLGNALKDQGKLDEALDACRRALELDPKNVGAHSNVVLFMNYHPRFSAADILAESRRWNARHAAALGENVAAHENDRKPDRRLRIGYVSPDFHDHPVAYFLEPLLAAHDRRTVEVCCYAEIQGADEVTARFERLAERWVPTAKLSDAALAERIRADKIDILVDLAGHTAGNRLLVFARRPAPVQVSWLGYPNTSGLDAIAYRLSDNVADPDGAADDHYTETLLRLPRGFLCYRPPDDAPDVAPPPAETAAHVTFGSFNNIAKLTPEGVAAWAAILTRVPGSRLLLKGRPLSDAATRQRYSEMFAGHGVDPARLDLLARIPGRAGHLAAYARVDIALDPFPYNGTTTTCEALWMGVPVVTLAGHRHASRVGASLLAMTGLDNYVAASIEDYVALAVSLAEDGAARQRLRGRLRQTVADSRLCDAPGFARAVEAAYRDIWRRWCTERK